MTLERYSRASGVALSTLCGYLRRERDAQKSGTACDGIEREVAGGAHLLEVCGGGQEEDGWRALGLGLRLGPEASGAKYRIEWGAGGVSLSIGGGFDSGEVERLVGILGRALGR